jgi:hypothetical protein
MKQSFALIVPFMLACSQSPKPSQNRGHKPDNRYRIEMYSTDTFYVHGYLYVFDTTSLTYRIVATVKITAVKP